MEISRNMNVGFIFLFFTSTKIVWKHSNSAIKLKLFLMHNFRFALLKSDLNLLTQFLLFNVHIWSKMIFTLMWCKSLDKVLSLEFEDVVVVGSVTISLMSRYDVAWRLSRLQMEWRWWPPTTTPSTPSSQRSCRRNEIISKERTCFLGIMTRCYLGSVLPIPIPFN